MTLAKKADRQRAGAGDTVTYMVTVTNDGPTDHPDAAFTDDLARCSPARPSGHGSAAAAVPVPGPAAGPAPPPRYRSPSRPSGWNPAAPQRRPRPRPAPAARMGPTAPPPAGVAVSRHPASDRSTP
ncbi:hypothetical protein ACFQ6N_00880 [Kitasatospora sp. NPDC056446]|uniref:hypothetical protein n=1 Tax=Kitasatospora sp. NPDC056446 TaxID=3345819 RepID=UPI0036B2558F